LYGNKNEISKKERCFCGFVFKGEDCDGWGIERGEKVGA